jgi:hypothetical protein
VLLSHDPGWLHDLTASSDAIHKSLKTNGGNEVERTGDRQTRRPPVLKITQYVLIRYENSLLNSSSAYKSGNLMRFDQI